MYGLFYAIAHLKLPMSWCLVLVANFNSFDGLAIPQKENYSIHISCSSNWFNRRDIVVRPDAGMFIKYRDWVGCELLDRQSLCHGLSTDSTESAKKIVFYFCFIGIHISNVLAVAFVDLD